MKIIVCPAIQAAKAYETYKPSHVIGLLSPGQDEMALATISAQRLDLRFNDIVSAQYGLLKPDETHLRAILDFAKSWDETAPMLVYCFAGISRSTAAAFTILCQHQPAHTEQSLAQILRKTSPSATPNPLMVSLADTLLERQGRMSQAVVAIGRGEGMFLGQSFELPLDALIS
jgi:predicted protein tyrosine phosphatase